MIATCDVCNGFGIRGTINYTTVLFLDALCGVCGGTGRLIRCDGCKRVLGAAVVSWTTDGTSDLCIDCRAKRAEIQEESSE